MKWITIEGFSVESDKLKTIQFPDNTITAAEVFRELMLLFQIQTIDEFIPVYSEQVLDRTLKNKLESILPYYVSLVEKKKMEEDSNEFERIYSLLDQTAFYSASEIKLELNFQSETFDGPSLTVYREKNEFYFKGKWNRERTLLSLIKELASLLEISGLNEELRFLLIEPDESEIKEWLVEQGIDLSTLQPFKLFTKPQMVVSVDPVIEEVSFEDVTTVEIIEDNEFEIEKTSSNSFKPASAPRSFNSKQIIVNSKTYIGSIVSEPNVVYSNIQSQQVRERVGRWCEEFIYDYLIKDGEFTEIVWVNQEDESGKPYDFKVKKNGVEKFIDVKGTPSEEKNIIYLSKNEWTFMFEKGKDYSIYRVYGAGETPSIDIVNNPAGLLQEGKIFPNPITIEI